VAGESRPSSAARRGQREEAAMAHQQMAQ
jgi:hypothetical protein